MFILNMATVSSNELSVCAVIPVSLLWTLSLSQLFLLCHLFDVIESASPALPRTPTDCTARLESPAWSAAPGEHDLWVCICSFVWLLCLAAVYGYCTLLAVIYIFVLFWLFLFIMFSCVTLLPRSCFLQLFWDVFCLFCVILMSLW